MKTVIEDSQLEADLQEACILSQHWIVDINFLEGEIRFLRNMFHKYLSPEPGHNLLVKAADLEICLAGVETNIPDLRYKVSELLKFTDPLIDEPDSIIGMDLLERFFAVALDIKLLSQSVTSAKKLVFAFVDAILKTESHDSLSII